MGKEIHMKAFVVRNIDKMVVTFDRGTADALADFAAIGSEDASSFVTEADVVGGCRGCDRVDVVDGHGFERFLLEVLRDGDED